MNGSNKLASIPTTIELLIDGQSRIVQVDENGHWETSVDDLSLARHTLVAKSGAVQSSPYSFVVEKPGPISEDWSNLDTDIFLSQGESYTSPHTGLKVTALYVAPGQVGLNRPHISANRLYSGSQQHIECLFPQPVTSISLIVFIHKGSYGIGAGSEVIFYNGSQILQTKPLTVSLSHYTITYDLTSPCTRFAYRVLSGNSIGAAAVEINSISWLPV
ncbi:hypothetical protein [Pseudomonas bohemica]|uniref:hypothetical protein n=1 Tax=Pseudomonas bohemica TaxID=2044872 RepID=UPI0018FEB3F6|nr:hypothetical protein [Pseudomonas bohemica]